MKITPKKLMKKLFSIVFIIIFSLLLTSCNPEENNDEPPTENSTSTPELEKAVKDEIIYVNMNQIGTIETMKVTNRITNSRQVYYEDYGKYNNSGNLNINNNSEIIVDDEKAIIPSLDEHPSMFYTLSMNKDYYASKLPFTITTTYKLDNIIVGYQDLMKATGIIEIIFEFKVNKNANLYYQNNYGAQVSIPIDLRVAEIISAPGAMQQMIVGAEAQIIYMIMPGKNQTIHLKLDARNFHFDGMQAIFQPIDIMSLAGDMINLDEFMTDDLTELPTQLNDLITQLEDANDLLQPMFKDLIPTMPTMIEENSSQIVESLGLLTEGLNDPQLNQAFQGLTSTASLIIVYNSSHTSQREWFSTKTTQIIDETESLTENYDLLVEEIDMLTSNLSNLENMANKYSILYEDFEEVLELFKDIQLASNILLDIEDFSLTSLITHQQELKDAFSIMGTSADIIKENMQNLIVNMYTLPNKFKPLMNLITPLINYLDSLKLLKTYYTEFANRLQRGINEGWFRSTYATQFQTLVDELTKVDETLDNPGLIQGITLAIEAGEDLGQLSELALAYEVDPETHLSQMDEIVYGFILINEGLTIVQPNQEMGFYDAMNLVKVVSQLLIEIPGSSSGILPSFLSLENLEPTMVQFIIKQRGF